MRAGFVVTDLPNPHIVRARELLRAHPEVRCYFRPYPPTAAWIVAIVALQLAVAFQLRDAGWGWVIAGAYLIGAFASHALFVLIHEAAHNLIVGNDFANRLLGILCNVGQGVPTAASFRTFHLLHHTHLDEYRYDADLAFEWEARLVRSSPLRKAVWLFLFAAIESVRPLRVNRRFTEGWAIANTVIIAATDLAIWWYCGWRGLSYIILSTIVGVGLHPVGARWIQEHYLFRPDQETYSYYGLLNWIAFNIGYHNEHHDLVKVPWVYLPRVKALAPELYDHLYAHRSWTRVLLQFLFDRQLDLFARITRDRSRSRAHQAAAV